VVGHGHYLLSVAISGTNAIERALPYLLSTMTEGGNYWNLQVCGFGFFLADGWPRFSSYSRETDNP